MLLNESIVTFKTYTWLSKMPAASKQQQKFMGIVRAIQKGDAPASKFSKKARDAAKSMSKKSVKKYAQTKHDDLPKKVREVSIGDRMANRRIQQIRKYFDQQYSRIKNAVERDARTGSKEFSYTDNRGEKYKLSVVINRLKELRNKISRKDRGLADMFTKNITPIEKVKDRMKESVNEVSSMINKIANNHMNKFDNDIKTSIKDIGKTDKKKALELMKLYKKHWVEFSIKAKKALQEGTCGYGIDGNLGEQPAGPHLLKKKKNGDLNEMKDPQVIKDLRNVLKKGYSSVKDPKLGRKMKVDTYTASAITQVYDAINTANKKKFSKLSIVGMSNIAFKFVKSSRGM